MARTYLPQDMRNAKPYMRKKLRQVVCAPLETLTDDYLHEQGWIVDAIFPPIPGLALDTPAKDSALIVVIRKMRKK